MDVEMLTEILNKLKLMENRIQELETEVQELKQFKMNNAISKVAEKETLSIEDAADMAIFHYKKQPCRR